MKKSLILILAVALCLSVCLVACTPNSLSIEQVLTEKANGDEVTTSGTVYGTVNGGFYLMDAEGGRIYVSANDQVAVGDKLTVTGTLAKGATVRPTQIKLTSLSKQGTEQVNLTAEQSSIEAICGMNSGAETGVYGKYVKVVGTYGKDVTGRYCLTDEDKNSVLLYTSSNTAALAGFEGKRVELAVVIHGYTANKFQVSFVGTAADVTEKPLSVADVKDEVVSWVETQLGHEKSGDFALPATYAPIPSVTLTWAVDSNEFITIEDNTAKVAALEAQQKVTLQLTIATTATDEVTVDYEVTVKPIVETTVTELLANANIGDTVKVTGVVMTYLSDGNTQGERHGYALLDPATGAIVIVNGAPSVGGVHGAYKATNGDSYGIGDEITVIGTYKEGGTVGSGPEQTGRKQIALGGGSVAVKTKNATYALEEAKKNAIVINNLDEQKDFAKNLDYGKLIKISATDENPLYIGMSANSFPVNFKLLFADGASNSDCQLPAADGGLQIFSIKSDINALNAGDLFWENAFGIKDAHVCPKDDDKMYPVTGDMYVMLANRTGTYFQLAVVDWTSNTLTPKAEDSVLAGIEINKAFAEKEIDATTAGTITLPTETTHAKGITWTVNPEGAINTQTGAYEAFVVTTTVVLTAHYKVNGEGEDQTYDVELTMTGATVKDVTVSEALEGSSDSIPSLIAYVAAFGSTSGNTAEQRAGLILTDGKLAMYYNTTTYAVDGTDIRIGDQLKITGATLSRANGARTLTGGTIEIVPSENTIDYSALTIDATITNEEEMLAYAAGSKALGGQIVKFEGPFWFVGTGTTGMTCRLQIHYKSEGVTSSAGARYDFDMTSKASKTFSFSMGGNALLIENWYEDVGATVGGTSKVSLPATGSFYAVSCGRGDTMYAWAIINADAWNVSPVVDNAKEADKEIKAAVTTTTFTTTEAGSFTLPESTEHAGTITWTSDKDEITVEGTTASYAVVTEATTVTLTATYTVDSEPKTTTIAITLNPAPAAPVE
ncbi:MAG: hypothetical protein NC350_04395 [Corallococcus sp.]|nr:hypothetical protein [Corallococcus sp.]